MLYLSTMIKRTGAPTLMGTPNPRSQADPVPAAPPARQHSRILD